MKACPVDGWRALTVKEHLEVVYVSTVKRIKMQKSYSFNHAGNKDVCIQHRLEATSTALSLLLPFLSPHREIGKNLWTQGLAGSPFWYAHRRATPSW